MMPTRARTRRPSRPAAPGRLLAVNLAACLLLLIQFLLGINYGHDFSSMIMAGLWALALACYLVGLFLAAWPLRLVRS